MVFLFWICIALIIYVYAGYPLLLCILAIVIRRRRASPTANLNLTMIICAHNEAASIEEKLVETLSLRYPSDKLQLLVVSDGSSDGTDEIVQRFTDRGVEFIRIDQQSGKTNAQNVAMSYARGEVVVFSDATTRYHPDALQYLAGNYTDSRVGAASGCYVYTDPAKPSMTAAGARAYATYDNTIRDLQSRVWSISGCCGCIYSVRRSLYTPLAANVISDLVQPLHVLRQGFRVTFEPRAFAWESATASPAREFSMRVRVVARALSGLLSVYELLLPWRAPWTALQLWSHKLLRWAIPVFLLGLLIASASLLRFPFYLIVFLIQVLLYSTAAVTSIIPLHRQWRPLGIPLFFCTVNAASVGGFVQLLRGQRYTFWQPERGDVDANS